MLRQAARPDWIQQFWWRASSKLWAVGCSNHLGKVTSDIGTLICFVQVQYVFSLTTLVSMLLIKSQAIAIQYLLYMLYNWCMQSGIIAFTVYHNKIHLTHSLIHLWLIWWVVIINKIQLMLSNKFNIPTNNISYKNNNSSIINVV